MRYIGIFVVLLIISCSVNTSEKQSADLLIRNGNVLLPEGTVEKTDIIIKNDTIASIGEKLDKEWKADSVIDAGGKFVMPGLIDAHAHFQGIGQSLTQVNLLETSSWSEVLDSIKNRVKNAKPGQWIVGRGWHQEKWSDRPEKTIEGFPVHKELSAISPDNPVMLGHASGHGLLANQKAMDLAGVDSETKSPEGGVIIQDENDQPIGVFQENAMNLIRSEYRDSQAERNEKEKIEEWNKFIRAAQKECLRYGITSLHDAGITMEKAQRYYDLASANELDLRLYSMFHENVVRTEDRSVVKDFMHRTDSLKFFQVKSIKAYMDGALGSRGAWLLDDYSDEKGYAGENVTPLDTIRKSVEIADEMGMQVCIHAIGDKANRKVLDIYEDIGGENLQNKRWRIEHAQHLHPDDIQRFSELGVIASMQPIHCTSDAPYVEKRLGEDRAESGAYVWNTLLESGAELAFGTDAPVESVDPFANLYAAVTRNFRSLDSAFYPEEAVSREEALRIYTEDNAFAEFAESKKGKIHQGYLADIIILDRNLMTCSEEEIPETKVLYTLVGGKVKYYNSTEDN